MKLASTLLALSLSAAAIAQTPAKPAATPAPAPTPVVAPAKPELPPQIPMPKVTGTPTTLYALTYIDTELGTGPAATANKWYTVHYTGWLPDGTMFDSSMTRGEPIVFPYGAHRVITGWDTGFEGMKVGGKRRLFVPYQLAYGEGGRPPVIPEKSQLIFDVQLLGVADNPPQPIPVKDPTPAAAPASTPAPATAPAAATPAPATTTKPKPATGTTKKQ